MRTARTASRLAAHGVLFLLVLELCARVDDRLAFGTSIWERSDADVLTEVDGAGITHNVPGAVFEKWRINRLGFRGEEPLEARPAGMLRVACLGQSESFGLYERRGGEWPALLGGLLEARHLRAEVLNASVVGPRRPTRLAFLERYVLPLEPDIVVVYPNVLNDGLAEQAGATPPAPRAAPSSPLQLRAWPKLRRRLRAWLPEAVVDPVRGWSLDRAVRLREQAVLGGRRPLDALPDQDLADFATHLRDVVRLLRSHGVRPVLATYPTLADEENRLRLHAQVAAERVWRVQLSELGMIDAARRLNQVTRQVGIELQVPVADVEAGLPRTLEYFGDYLHYTDAGAARVAAIVAETLGQPGLLSAEGGPRRPSP